MRRWSLLAVALASLGLSSCTGDYGDIMRKAFQAALGSDFATYTFRTYPVDNFGVYTMYDRTYDPGSYLCATWSCLNTQPTSPDKKLSVNDYADVGNGGALNLSNESSSDTVVSIVVPQIMNMVTVNATGDWRKHVKLSLSTSGVHQRFVNAQKFADFIKKLPDSSVYKQSFNKGTLVIIGSDLVVDSLKVTIDVETNDTSGIGIMLDNALTNKVGTVIGQGAEIKYHVDAAQNGHYELSTVDPVISAVYPKLVPHPAPDGGVSILQAGGQFDDVKKWKNAKIPVEQIKGITQKLSAR